MSFNIVGNCYLEEAVCLSRDWMESTASEIIFSPASAAKKLHSVAPYPPSFTAWTVGMYTTNGDPFPWYANPKIKVFFMGDFEVNSIWWLIKGSPGIATNAKSLLITTVRIPTLLVFVPFRCASVSRLSFIWMGVDSVFGVSFKVVSVNC